MPDPQMCVHVHTRVMGVRARRRSRCKGQTPIPKTPKKMRQRHTCNTDIMSDRFAEVRVYLDESTAGRATIVLSPIRLKSDQDKHGIFVLRSCVRDSPLPLQSYLVGSIRLC